MEINRIANISHEKSDMLYRKMQSTQKSDRRSASKKQETKIALFLKGIGNKNKHSEETPKNKESNPFHKRLAILDTMGKNTNLRVGKSIDESAIEKPLFFRKQGVGKIQHKVRNCCVTAVNLPFSSYEYPCSRMLSSLLQIRDQVYVFGGISSENHFDVWCFDLKTRTWKLLFNNNLSMFSITHIFSYNDVLYLVSIKPLTYKNEFFLPKILTLNLKMNTFEKLKAFDRFRIYEFGLDVYSQYLFLVGGVDEYGKYNDGICILDCKTQKFESLNIYYKYIYQARKSPAVAFINYTRSLFNKDPKTQIFCFTEEHSLNGLYVFGGSYEDEIFSDMFKISFKVKGVKIKKVSYSGEAPKLQNPQFYYLEKTRCLVANSQIYILNEVSDFDLKLACFFLEKQEWVTVKKNFNMRLANYGICGSDDRIFIFGGISENRNLQNSLYMFDFSSYKYFNVS